MKKVIVFRVEDVLVKDFNKEDSLRRAISIETNKLKKIIGEESNREELEKVVKEKKEWVDRREREFYDREFERSKFKSGIG